MFVQNIEEIIKSILVIYNVSCIPSYCVAWLSIVGCCTVVLAPSPDVVPSVVGNVM